MIPIYVYTRISQSFRVTVGCRHDDIISNGIRNGAINEQ